MGYFRGYYCFRSIICLHKRSCSVMKNETSKKKFHQGALAVKLLEVFCNNRRQETVLKPGSLLNFWSLVDEKIRTSFIKR